MGWGKILILLKILLILEINIKSIFEYFIRATDILINDHIKLLLKEMMIQLS